MRLAYVRAHDAHSRACMSPLIATTRTRAHLLWPVSKRSVRTFDYATQSCLKCLLRWRSVCKQADATQILAYAPMLIHAFHPYRHQ